MAISVELFFSHELVSSACWRPARGVGGYLFPALAVQMTWSLLQQPVSVWLRAYQWIFVAFFILLVAVPGQAAMYQTLPIWQYFTVPVLVMVTWLIVRQALAGNREAPTVVVGVLLFVATCINDLMIDLVGVGNTRLVPFGFVAIMLAMSASLANRFFEFSGRPLSITMTFGVSSFQTGDTLDSCIARADAALYRGKKRGRNNVMVCRDEELVSVDSTLQN